MWFEAIRKEDLPLSCFYWCATYNRGISEDDKNCTCGMASIRKEFRELPTIKAIPLEELKEKIEGAFTESWMVGEGYSAVQQYGLHAKIKDLLKVLEEK